MFRRRVDRARLAPALPRHRHTLRFSVSTPLQSGAPAAIDQRSFSRLREKVPEGRMRAALHQA
ncbi:hypothetical protein FHY18_001036 [Xanthomonas arboricola]|uniref:hypothetical protein n=1 Tax=Xanthomonas sp. 3793 TaxID=3035312 RepID=UPI00216979FC|nr:hypothetical protein [Xanthomonas sp. 3793]MCS3745506.1 hypothetical protein [Xanthomonas sp. 3793]